MFGVARQPDFQDGPKRHPQRDNSFTPGKKLHKTFEQYAERSVEFGMVVPEF